MLTQKDLYDFISKNGLDAYKKMMNDVMLAAENAEAQYMADQKKKEEKMAVDTKRIGTLTDLLNDWFPPEAFRMVSPEKMAESFYKVVEDYSKISDVLMTHAKDVDIKTEEIPGGTKTTIQGKVDPKAAADAFNGLKDEISKLFKL